MQTKTTVRYHLIPVRVATIKKLTNNKWMWRKGNSSALLVGMQIGVATVESSMDLTQKI